MCAARFVNVFCKGNAKRKGWNNTLAPMLDSGHASGGERGRQLLHTIIAVRERNNFCRSLVFGGK